MFSSRYLLPAALAAVAFAAPADASTKIMRATYAGGNVSTLDFGITFNDAAGDGLLRLDDIVGFSTWSFIIGVPIDADGNLAPVEFVMDTVDSIPAIPGISVAGGTCAANAWCFSTTQTFGGVSGMNVMFGAVGYNYRVSDFPGDFGIGPVVSLDGDPGAVTVFASWDGGGKAEVLLRDVATVIPLPGGLPLLAGGMGLLLAAQWVGRRQRTG